jgi:hypothetical protein
MVNVGPTGFIFIFININRSRIVRIGVPSGLSWGFVEKRNSSPMVEGIGFNRIALVNTFKLLVPIS